MCIHSTLVLDLVLIGAILVVVISECKMTDYNIFFPQLNIRHLLRVSGVTTTIYWLYLFISDAIVFLIPAILLLILVPAIQISSLSPPAAMGCLVLAVILYLPTGILFSYCLSFLFSKWETCQQVLPSLFTYVSHACPFAGSEAGVVVYHSLFIAVVKL